MEVSETEWEGASQLMKQHCITLKEGAVPLQAGKKLSMVGSTSVGRPGDGAGAESFYLIVKLEEE